MLLVQLQQVGDSVAVTPAVRAIRRRYPLAEIDLLAGPAAAEVFRGSPHVRLVHRVGGAAGRWRRAIQWARVLAALRRTRYDCILACTNHVSVRHGVMAWLVAWVTGARRRIGFDRAGRGFLFTDRLARDSTRSCYEENLDLARAVGARIGPGDATPGEMWADGEDAAVVAALLATRGVPDCPLVVLHPGSNWQSKTWYPERWAAVADRLATEGYYPVFIGTAHERCQIERIRGGMRSASASLAGDTGLRPLAALLARSTLFIGTDSGPRHVAASAGCAQVTVTSAQDHRGRWRIPGAREIILRGDPPCAGCLRSSCAHRQCMIVILADQVVEACHQLRTSAPGQVPRYGFLRSSHQ